MTGSDLIHRWFDGLWNRADESTIDALAHADIVVHGLGESPIQGRDEFHAFYRSFRAAFPTVMTTVHQVLESGDHAVGRVGVEVTAADGRGPFTFEGSVVVRIRNGVIEEGWNYFDFLTLMTQMGAVPADVMATAIATAAAPAV